VARVGRAIRYVFAVLEDGKPWETVPESDITPPLLRLSDYVDALGEPNQPIDEGILRSMGIVIMGLKKCGASRPLMSRNPAFHEQDGSASGHWNIFTSPHDNQEKHHL
jgi:hypothetical protein